MEDFFNADLFLPGDFTTRSYKFDDPKGEIEEPVSVDLVVSDCASTDFDLTGVIVWPVSHLLTYYVIQQRDSFEGKRILEVGAGCGMAGLVMANYCESIVVTDGEEAVISMIRESCDLHANVNLGNVNVAQYVWGDDVASGEYLDQYPMPDVVIGADVFHPSFGDPALLFNSMVYLRGGKKGLSFIVGFVDRGHRESVLGAAADAGFSVTEMSSASCLPTGIESEALSGRNMCIFHFQR